MKLIFKSIFLCFLLVSVCRSNASAEHWRQWNVYDGLAETWSQSITLTPKGIIYISHGSATPNASILKGFAIERFPRQHPYNPYYGFTERFAFTFGKHDSIEDPYYFLQRIQFNRDRNLNEWIDYESTATELRFAPLFRHPSGSVIYLSSNSFSALNVITGKNTVLLTAENTKIGLFTEMVSTPKGDVWVGGTDGIVKVRVPNIQTNGAIVLFRLEYPYNPRCTRFVQMSSYGEERVVGSYEVDERSLLLEWNGKKWETLTESEPYQGLKGWRDSKNKLWKYDKVNGLFHVREDGEEISFHDDNFLSGEINDFAIGDDGSFWLATENGIVRHAEFLWQPPEGLSDNQISCHCILEDRMGRIWFACKDTLLKYNRGEWKRYLLPDKKELYRSTTSPLASTPEGKVILFTDKDSFIEFDPENETFQSFSMPNRDGYYFMKQVSDDQILVLANIKNEKISIQRIENHSFQLEKEIDLSGLPEEYKKQNIYLRDYFETQNGKEYVSTLSGVFLNYGKSLRRIGPLDSAMCSAPRSDGSIWFGYHEGIASYRYDRWSIVRKPMNYVRSVIEASDGCMWAATKDGVSRYYRNCWLDYTLEDGLPNSPVNIVFEDSWKRIWVGTNSGIYVYHPEADPDEPDTLLSPERNIDEISPSGNVQILYSGIDCWKYTQSERLLYSHQLDRGDWSPFAHGTVVMASGVSYGNHVFKVRAMDVAGNIDRTPAVFEFEVMHPWYRNRFIQAIASLGIVVIVWLIERWYKAILKLRTYATTDGLTKLFNRRYFWEQTQKEWERTKRYGGDLSLIVADIDFFKKINDRYGHQNGDRVLETVSYIIAQSIRSLDIAGRIGGEEFAILLPGASLTNATLIAERIRTAISKKPIQVGDVEISVTISLGISTKNNDIENLDVFFSTADAALYKAKDSGRNRLVIQESA